MQSRERVLLVYMSQFKILTEEEIELLSEEDLKEYLKSLEEYKKEQSGLLSSINQMKNDLDDLEQEEKKLKNKNDDQGKIEKIRAELLTKE